MSKINNNKITYTIILSLGILAILAFLIITFPLKASAEPGYVTPYKNPNNNYDIAPAYISPNYSTIPVVYSNNPNTSQTNNTTISRTADNTNTYSSNTSTENLDTVTTSESTENSSNLAGNAIFGSNSFAPSGLVQWIFFAILILLVVIIVRRIFGGAEKYHAEPMKHA